MGIDTAALRHAWPGVAVVELAIVARDGLAVLEDLAGDDRFRGLVLFDLQPPTLLPAAWDDQGANVRYYRTQWSLAAARTVLANAGSGALRQCVAEPQFAAFRLGAPAPDVDYAACLRVLGDRSLQIDLERPGVTEAERQRVIPRRRQTPRVLPPDPAGWLDGLARLNRAVERIDAEGDGSSWSSSRWTGTTARRRAAIFQTA